MDLGIGLREGMFAATAILGFYTLWIMGKNIAVEHSLKVKSDGSIVLLDPVTRATPAVDEDDRQTVALREGGAGMTAFEPDGLTASLPSDDRP